MMKLGALTWIIVGAVIGGLIGWSGLLCPNGACAITGTWVGGALFGAFGGMAIAGGGCPACAFTPRQEPGNDGGSDESSEHKA